MAANLAAVAFSKGVPLAADAFARYMPAAVAKAKAFVGKSLGVPPATVNLGIVAQKSGGQYAQTVAEALVKSGMPVDALWSHMPRSVITDSEMIDYRKSLVEIQNAESDESSANALGTSVSKAAVLQLDEKNRSVEMLMKMFGTNDPNEVWLVKVELDHLHEADIENYLLTKRG